MWLAIEQIATLKPIFMSVTYGAGGTTRNNTNRIAREINRRTGVNAAAHLTCIRAPKIEIDEIAREHWNTGIRHIVALRGDPPKDNTETFSPKDRYLYATDLIRGLKLIGDFEISVAAFPEKHPESVSFEQDIEILKIKADLGVTRAITQYFFDNEHFLRFRDRVHKAKIALPVVPGIIPIHNFASIKRFSAMCQTSIPASVASLFEPLDSNPEARDKAAIAFAIQQCQDLINEGATRFHFYTMNRGDLISAICNSMGAKNP